MTRLLLRLGWLWLLIWLAICFSALWIGQQLQQRLAAPQLIYAGEWDTIYLTDLHHHLTLPLITQLPTIPLAIGWQPHGNALTYTLINPRTGVYRLYLYDLDTRQAQPLVPDEPVSGNIVPAWSPDGASFAFIADSSDICIFTLSSKLTRCLHLVDIRQIAWSPDGLRLAYIRGGAEEGGLYVTDVTGSVHRRLVPAPSGKTLASPAWSPDSRSLAYLVDYRAQPIRDLYLVDTQNGAITSLKRDAGFIFGVVWSPDGKQLAYHAARSEQTDIYVLSLADHREQRLTDETADEGGVQWSPDGTMLAYISNRSIYPALFLQSPHPASPFTQIASTVSFALAWRPGS